jgi:oligoribonuclease NrnB/cAMP/cGMP phosphodiesterase (DHH superfamily)
MMTTGDGSTGPRRERVAILYHDNCYDGAAAAAVAILWCHEHGHVADPIPQRFGNPPPDVSLHNRVIVADFSYPRATMEALANAVGTSAIRVFDHHKTARDEFAGLPYAVFDMERSGAGITWDELFPAEPRPWWVRYVEDRDLWRFALPESREVNAYMQTRRPTFETFLALHASGLQLEDVMQLGRGAQAFIDCYVEEMNENLKRWCQVGEFGGIPVLNVPYKETSSVVGRAAEGVLFAVGWHQSADGKYLYSLRSDEKGSNFDVAEFAKRFGGGGHRNAAGFRSDRQLW